MIAGGFVTVVRARCPCICSNNILLPRYLIDDHQLNRNTFFAQRSCQARTFRGSHQGWYGHYDELGGLRFPEQSLCLFHTLLQGQERSEFVLGFERADMHTNAVSSALNNLQGLAELSGAR